MSKLDLFIERLDGFSACNLNEPSSGDLERVYAAYQKAWDERNELKVKLEACQRIKLGDTLCGKVIAERDELKTEVERLKTDMRTMNSMWQNKADSLSNIAENYRAKLGNIEICCGYDPTHVGDSISLLQEIIETLRKEARQALEER